ncbi:MAG: efflux transporter outer membrane subunit [Pseudomonadota bacterium]|nr:efflux transporter outer membrane subunit [Pseudomonadota bacterium]
MIGVSNMLSFAKVASAGAAGILLVSCAVGPDYHAPAAPPANGFVPPDVLPTVTAEAPVAGGQAQHFVPGADIPRQWWTLFASPQLNELIERGLQHSPTLEAAQAALRQANETAAAQRGALWPSVNGAYQGQRQRVSSKQFGLPGQGSFLYTLNSASVNVSYTLDAFGGIRRQVEAQQAQADYQRYALEASYLTLTSNIVTAAITEASLRAQLAANEEIATSQRAELDIARRQMAAGGASRADVLQQQATLQSTLAALPALRSQLAQERNQLAAYVGELPADYAAAAVDLDAMTLPIELPVSLPSQLVNQRPDVQEYAALLHSATAQIGVATANMLPQLTLTGSYGGVATRFADVFSPNAAVWSLIGGVTQPLFRGGQLAHQRRAAVAAAQEAAANYRSTVLTAFQNVSNTLYALQSDAEALAAQSLAQQTAAQSLKLIQSQFRSGGASHLQVLTAEQSYQTAAIALVKARAQRFADTAALFQALGGGWWNPNDLAASATHCCKEIP